MQQRQSVAIMPVVERVAMHYLIFVYIVLCIYVGVCNKTRIYYFAYGSNLLGSRLHNNIPTAEFYTTAFLKVRSLEISAGIQAIRSDISISSV